MPADTRSPADMLTRVGVGVAVPAIAVAAHGVASGTAASARGVALCAAIGALLATVDGVRGRSRATAVVGVAALLGFAQVACHWALVLGDPSHGWHDGRPSMIGSHLVAIPVTAVAVVVAAACADLLTATIAAITASRVPLVATRPRVLARRVFAPATVAWGGAGVRGPPAGR
ncbi:YtxH domain-containing protein [Gordonia sp. ABSL1-1]|uniref:YtxH domain-containing protein n=1 Tax=Gordonia sp. ABSL1-1 TaxID=3053923 RepID=UPI002573C5E1|nr:YtxH domain-containing protein [Gordonia sp. ABSL1-1]MDL9936002.1 YtxH domain-containing protein [Gordonia sp. ABSL1-1]